MGTRYTLRGKDHTTLCDGEAMLAYEVVARLNAQAADVARLRDELATAHEQIGALRATINQQLPDLLAACDGFVWLGKNLHNIVEDPARFRTFFEFALDAAAAALAKARGETT